MEVLLTEAFGLRFAGALLIMILSVLFVRWIMRPSRSRLRLYILQAGIVAAVLALVALVYTGRLHWLFVAVGIALPLTIGLVIWCWRALAARHAAHSVRPSSSPNASQTLKVETRFLRMSLNHDTGDMRGKVLKGALAGRHLSELSLEQLRQLHADYSGRDTKSGALIGAYLERMYGAGVHEPNAAKSDHGDKDEKTAELPPPTDKPNGMTRHEAYDILGLATGADAKAINDAHRRLMQKLHPDRGGTNYLAAKINQAKDLLLEA